MKGQQESLIGQTFNKWTVLAEHGRSERGHVYYVCRCFCGRERPVRADALKSGQSRSCGCSQFERFAHLYKDDQQHCPSCQNWLPLHAYSKYYQGKVGEQCRECRQKRGAKSRQSWSREQKREKTLKNSYGLTLKEYYRIAARQGNRCLGCQELFEPLDLVVDHDHATGQIRGLLCNSCNTILGQVKDKEGTLYRLSAYLSRNPNQLLVYFIGSLRNERVKTVAHELRQFPEFDGFDDYMAAGPGADDAWKIYENERGRSYAEALQGRAASHVFHYDRSYLDLADAAVVVLPAGKSAMIEAGYCTALGKPVYFLRDPNEDDGRYDVMKKFATGMVDTVEELRDGLLSVLGQYLPQNQEGELNAVYPL